MTMDIDKRTRVACWLLACCAILFTLIVVGGITRLTRSGLSIVEWQPVIGVLPPLTEEAWHAMFEKYRATPEYLRVNKGMSLEGFKGIFWWEYAHRLLARILGLAFLLPFLLFLWRGWLDRRTAVRLAAILALGALQGAMGWYMVKSGLVDDPRVSHLRLTAHLGLAFAIFAAMLWVALGLLRPSGPGSGTPRVAGARRLAGALPFLAFAMVLTGGLVAGIRAGYAYNTFPLMNGHLVPPEILMIEPWYLNFFNNMATVQFNHRLIAWLLALLVPAVWMMCRSRAVPAGARAAASLLLALFALQVGLGIATLLLRVPIGLAATHQAGAVLVFATTLWLAHELRRV